MSLIEINWKPTPRQLRQFSLICFVALPCIGWLWGAQPPAVGILASVGCVLALVGLVRPQWITPVFLLLSLITFPIGLLIGELALLMIYFGMFVPMACLFRVMGRDSLQIRRRGNRTSYWENKKEPADVASYFRQS